MRTSSITKSNSDFGYESVLLFYNAVPVKEKYVRKFMFNNKHLKAQLDESALKKLANNFKAYMSSYWKGKPAGFLVRLQQQGKDISGYQYKAKEIKKVLYKDYFAVKQAERKAKLFRAALEKELQDKKELKRAYKLAAHKLEDEGKDIQAAIKDSLQLLPLAHYNLYHDKDYKDDKDHKDYLYNKDNKDHKDDKDKKDKEQK